MLDVDDKRQYDSYYRIQAVVYVNETNLNEKMVKEGYAEVMYIPPSEFDSREWGVGIILDKSIPSLRRETYGTKTRANTP